MPAITRGAYGIVLTTYDEHDEVDHRDLTTQADFVATTAQGVVWPVLASEFYLMTIAEIQAGYPAIAAGNRGRRSPCGRHQCADHTRCGTAG